MLSAWAQRGSCPAQDLRDRASHTEPLRRSRRREGSSRTRSVCPLEKAGGSSLGTWEELPDVLLPTGPVCLITVPLPSLLQLCVSGAMFPRLLGQLDSDHQ